MDDNDEPSAPLHSSIISIDTANTDLAVEKETALLLWYSMHGEADEDWGGAESVDSDLEREAATASRADADPHTSQSSNVLDVADFEIVPVDQTVSKKSSVNQRRPTPTTTTAAAPRNPDPAQPSTPPPTTLKDLLHLVKRKVNNFMHDVV